jgi:hypothetical protein
MAHRSLLQSGEPNVTIDHFKQWATQYLEDLSAVLHQRFELIPSPITEKKRVTDLLANFKFEHVTEVAFLSKKWWEVWCSYVEYG